MSKAFDASSMIYAWDNYPPANFPPLWRWMECQIQSETFVMPSIAFDELKTRAPDCHAWLREKQLARISVTNAILEEAVRIKALLGIEGERYHPKGVGENDILIVATAAVECLELISNEGRQHILPKDRAKMKIPAVCELEAVNVPCMDFVTLIRQSDEVFGD